MKNSNIKPETITKPIQLLAVWLVSLLLLETILLTAAKNLTDPVWISSLLAISAVAIIPLFLVLIFVLQTRFRPQMQEDSYYSKWLFNKETNKYELENEYSEKETKMNEIKEIRDRTERQIEDTIREIDNSINNNEDSKNLNPVMQKSKEELENLAKQIKLNELHLGINKLLPHYQNIIDVIQSVGFTKYSLFGDSNIGIPEPFVISFGKGVTIDVIKEIIEPISKFSHCYIKKSTTAKNAIIIGSYRTYDKMVSVDEKMLNNMSALNNNDNIDRLLKSH
ncbi:MAG: hypothetical protein AAF849_04145 [Bacteroidota bacterium]